ncbi:MAG: superoxide dismutase [Fe], partial [Geminocystis sp. GBBB08]|nr:superoxide dismutase [Fe] [Geminocystis sp. GBBB08]
MAYQLPTLPFDYTALEPYISKSTLEFHHDKHHAAYINNFNNAVAGTDLDSKSLEEVITITATNPSQAGIFNNA